MSPFCPGSGTLANDAIAAQLSLLDGRGLVLSNGEFGERLIDHARRFGLSFDVLKIEWGEAFTREGHRAGSAGGGGHPLALGRPL
jgi:aspartate aminotransferase-like enzyme